MSAEPASEGLEGVVAAKTILSHADGEEGVVWVRGHTIDDLVAHHGYEGTIALLWDGFAGDGLTRDTIAGELGAARALAFSRLDDWLPGAARRPPIEGLRMGLAALRDDSAPAAIAATFPVAIAALIRAGNGKPPVPPDPSLTTAADFLRMVNGAAVDARFAAALDSYLTTVIDNGLGTSTFAARVIISTRASLTAAVVGAYGAFTGPLHGGAPGLALDMLDAIAASGDMDQWLDRTLAGGGRLMGFGHRVFRVRDPRADMLRAALQRLDPGSERLAFAREVERRALAALQRRKPGRRLEANIEMDAALLLDAIGLPREAFTPVFAIARAPAWIAHALEQQRTGRMIRPASTYVGPPPP
jgi:citrate synthase